MSDIEYEMDKYTKLITNKVYSITNLINDLKELYKTKEIILNQKSNFSEIEMNETEKEKTNYLKINDNISQDNNLNEKNDINENINMNEETILKRGLIKSKIITQSKYNTQEGKIQNGFQIVINFCDFQYYLGPFNSKNFTYNLNNVIINKLDEVSNKWGYCTKLSNIQRNSLFNCLNQVEITINKFFRDNNNVVKPNDSDK
jgi:hypothetical protein